MGTHPLQMPWKRAPLAERRGDVKSPYVHNSHGVHNQCINLSGLGPNGRGSIDANDETEPGGSAWHSSGAVGQRNAVLNLHIRLAHSEDVRRWTPLNLGHNQLIPPKPGLTGGGCTD